MAGAEAGAEGEDEMSKRASNCYRVKVRTTNACRDTFCLTGEDVIPGEYRDCERGEVFVIAESIAGAVGMLPPEIVEGVERMGAGYLPADLWVKR